MKLRILCNQCCSEYSQDIHKINWDGRPHLTFPLVCGSCGDKNITIAFNMNKLTDEQRQLLANTFNKLNEASNMILILKSKTDTQDNNSLDILESNWRGCGC